MRNIFLFMLLISSALYIQAQDATKEETEQWILSKLRINEGKEYKLIYSMSIVVTSNWRFEDGCLCWTSVEKYDNGFGVYGQTETLHYAIPIYAINSENWVFSGETEISVGLNCDCLKCEKGFWKSISFPLSCNSEANLQDRMNKAFQHLKTFYPDPHKGEKF